MLLRRLKSNSTINLFFIPIAVLAFWAKSLLHPFIYDYSSYENKNILFKPIANLVGDNPFIHVLLSVVLVIILAFFMQLINDRYAFIRIRSKLPSILYIIILGGFIGMHTLHPIYFGAIFVLFAINRLFMMIENAKAYSAVFDVGFLLGVGSLFCSNLIILFPAFIISVAILSRKTRLREFLIVSLGFALPFVFAISYAFLNNHLQETLNTFAQSITIRVNHFKTNYALQGYLAVLVLYSILSSLDILKQYDKKKVSSRKYFSVFFWIFVFSLISFTFVPAASQEMLVISAIPVTYLISNFFVFVRNRFWMELLFTILLLIVIFMQFSEQFFNG